MIDITRLDNVPSTPALRTPIDIKNIECVLDHESYLPFFHACPLKSAILNLTGSEKYCSFSRAIHLDWID
jgi:hypothetical protein